MENIIDKIRLELENNADAQTKSTSQNYFKEHIQFHGVKIPVVNRISKEYFKLIESKSKNEIFFYCDELWQSGYIEESFVACSWSYNIRERFEPNDFGVLEKWITNNVNNWASCDTLCNHTVGAFVMLYPEYLLKLKEFTKSNNRWVRRASAVSLIIPARQGKFLPDILEIAESLLTDTDDLVQKGYGWMLKAASEANQRAIFDFVMNNKKLMPRTALRYAIEKMPVDLRSLAMIK